MEEPESSLTNKKIREILTGNATRLLSDVIGPLRNVVANLIISLSFLVGSEIIFLIIDWTSTDIKERIEFVGWALDGAQVISFIATLGIFILSTISDFRLQWSIIKRLENNDAA